MHPPLGKLLKHSLPLLRLSRKTESVQKIPERSVEAEIGKVKERQIFRRHKLTKLVGFAEMTSDVRTLESSQVEETRGQASG